MISGKADVTIAVQMVRSADKRINQGALIAVGVGADYAKRLCKQMVSQLGDDHTLKQLAQMGHPYAKRDPQEIHSPNEQVHARRGDLVRGMVSTRPVAHQGYVEASVYNEAQPLDTFIQGGTQTMIGRPYMEYVRKQWGDAIANAMRRAFVAFGPTELRRVA